MAIKRRRRASPRRANVTLGFCGRRSQTGRHPNRSEGCGGTALETAPLDRADIYIYTVIMFINNTSYSRHFFAWTMATIGGGGANLISGRG